MESSCRRLLGVSCCLVSMLMAFTLLTGCVSTQQIITGTPLTPIETSQVKVYSRPPATFKEIAILNATPNDLLDINQAKGNDAIIQHLKSVAASLGANGILIRALDGKQAGTIGDVYGLSSATAAKGNSQTITAETPTMEHGVHAVAIFVLEEEN